ncbi:MAG TPA: hypothetical protein VK689_07275, partial [Armatimonadota bacterium]|nr:hypothetical protein [Armatimonadota bacterium]
MSQQPVAHPPHAALALARELLHAVEQFVVRTPDLDTDRFLRRMRGTAAGITPEADAPTLRLYQKWVQGALAAFASLQHRYVAEREEEMWRLLDTCGQAAVVGHVAETELIDEVREAHERLRALGSATEQLADRAVLQQEVQRIRKLVEQRAREHRDRTERLSRQVAALQSALEEVRGQAN